MENSLMPPPAVANCLESLRREGFDLKKVQPYKDLPLNVRTRIVLEGLLNFEKETLPPCEKPPELCGCWFCEAKLLLKDLP